MKIVPFSPIDLQRLFNQGLFIEPSETLFDEILSRAKPGEIYSAYGDDSKVLVIGGIVSYWAGVGEAWALYDKNLKRNFRTSLEITRAMLIRIMDRQCFHRVQATCKASDKGCKFLEYLGFSLQGSLRKFNPDKSDSFMYEILEGNN